jgi:prepilin-type N-terminal cleavage/methylation domain-containing protein
MYEAKKSRGACSADEIATGQRGSRCAGGQAEVRGEPVWYCAGGPPGKSWQGGTIRLSRPIRERGFTLTELLVALCIMGLLVALSAPAVTRIHRRVALASLSRELSCRMVSARARAVLQHQSVALVFERDAEQGWRCFIAEDGDDDGINRDDLNRGRDVKVSEVYGLTGRGASLGFLQQTAIPDPSGRGKITGDLDDPIRAGRGDIVTFTWEGTATPCSIYFTDRHSRMRVIRVYGGTGKIHMYEWQIGWPAWKRPKR